MKYMIVMSVIFIILILILILIILRIELACGMAGSVVECLPDMHKVLGSIREHTYTK